MTPVQVCWSQADPAGEVPPRQLGTAHAVAQDAAQPFSRDLAWYAQRAANVLMMDGDVEQGEPAPEGGGQPLWPKLSAQLLKELFTVSDASSSTPRTWLMWTIRPRTARPSMPSRVTPSKLIT